MKYAVLVTVISLFFSFSIHAKKRIVKNKAISNKIEKLYNAKKYESVINSLSGKWSSTSIQDLSLLSSSYAKLNLTSQQIKVLEFLKAKNETQFIWHYKLGTAYERLFMETQKKAHQQTAITNYRKTISINTNFKPPYNKLLQIFAANGNLYEGRTIATEILSQFGSSPKVSQSLCKLYSLDGFIQEAKHHCSLAIEESPEVGDSHMYLANAYLDQGNKVIAKKMLSKAGQDFPKSEYVQVTVGDFNFSEGLYRASFENYKKALKVNKKNKRAQVGVAQSLFKLSKPKRALAHYIEACKIDPRLKKEFKIAIGSLLNSGQNKLYTSYENSLYKCHN